MSDKGDLKPLYLATGDVVVDFTRSDPDTESEFVTVEWNSKGTFTIGRPDKGGNDAE